MTKSTEDTIAEIRNIYEAWFNNGIMEKESPASNAMWRIGEALADHDDESGDAG